MTLTSTTIIKLGGSCFSDKTIPRSLHLDVIENLCSQLTQIDGDRFVLVHGGGSFGHPVAKQYEINNGKNDAIPDQQLGFSLTHQAMAELNQTIVGKLLDHGIPAYPVQTSAVFMIESGRVATGFPSVIDNLLDERFMPVLYGDSVLDAGQGYGIMSGDAIVVELANGLQNEVHRIVYLLDVDGLYDKNPKLHEDATLIPEVFVKDGELFVQISDEMVPLADHVLTVDSSIDVTGGIMNKINELCRITRRGIEAFLINGHDPTSMVDLLQGNLEKLTKITFLW
jgi:isopentenyl phosphate kinase